MSNLSTAVRCGVYVALIAVGLFFFFFNRADLLRYMGLIIAVVCSLALIIDPILRAYDRKRQQDSPLELDKD